MNKLISRSPVQRFKQGRKILFAKWGDKAEDPTPIKVPGTNEYYFGTWTGGDIIDGTKLIRDTEQVRKKDERHPFYENYIGGPYSRISRGKSMDAYYSIPLDRTNSYKATNSKPVIDEKQLPKKSKQIITNNIFIKGFQNRKGEIKDVKAMQNELIKLGLLKDRFGADGKWGKNTEAAYQKYLSLKNIPTYEKPKMPSVAAMAGIYSEENKPLYQRIRFKQGGQLPSKNIIERFKLRIKK